jgi:hypothetical protein
MINQLFLSSNVEGRVELRHKMLSRKILCSEFTDPLLDTDPLNDQVREASRPDGLEAGLSDPLTRSEQWLEGAQWRHRNAASGRVRHHRFRHCWASASIIPPPNSAYQTSSFLGRSHTFLYPSQKQPTMSRGRRTDCHGSRVDACVPFEVAPAVLGIPYCSGC